MSLGCIIIIVGMLIDTQGEDSKNLNSLQENGVSKLNTTEHCRYVSTYYSADVPGHFGNS